VRNLCFDRGSAGKGFVVLSILAGFQSYFQISDAPIRLSLSTKGLQRLETVNHERDFAFMVGSGRYACPSFVAEFLSPQLNSLRSQDTA
jgi:hypothetical protein